MWRELMEARSADEGRIDPGAVTCRMLGVRSQDLKDALAPAQTLGNEQGIEVFYNLAPTPWSVLGFDLQPQLMGNSAAAPACARRRS
jgi:hypothetical protein